MNIDRPIVGDDDGSPVQVPYSHSVLTFFRCSILEPTVAATDQLCEVGTSPGSDCQQEQGEQCGTDRNGHRASDAEAVVEETSGRHTSSAKEHASRIPYSKCTSTGFGHRLAYERERRHDRILEADKEDQKTCRSDEERCLGAGNDPQPDKCASRRKLHGSELPQSIGKNR